MTGWNLPPGCNVCDIPGNRPIDVAWDKWLENGYHTEVCSDCDHYDMCFYRIDGLVEDCIIMNDAFSDWYYEGEDE